MVSGKIDLKPANKKAIAFYIIFALLFYGAGIVCLIVLWSMTIPNGSLQTFGEALANWAYASYWWVLLVAFIGLIVLGLFFGWVLLKLVARFGHILVYAGVVFYIVGALIGAAVGFFIGGVTVGLYSLMGLAPVVFLVIGLFTNRNKFKRAGEFMKFTGKVVLAEKGMILAPLFVTFMSLLSLITMAAIFTVFISWFYILGIDWLGYVIGSIVSLIQLIVYYGVFYTAEAINTTYAYEWYRKRDPDMKFCRKNVAGNFGAIFTFGVVTALVSWVQRMLRNASTSAKSKGALILALFARMASAILGFVFKYLTYFTLPVITVEGTKFKEGVTRSFSLLKRYYMDVLIRETGVKGAMNIIQWISIFIYGIIGVIIGLVLKLTGTSATWTGAMLITVLPALVFASIPTFFIFRPMKTAYLTFVFAYAQDEESGFKLPTRMPAELRGDMKEARNEMDTSKSIAAFAER
ncbi:MAG: hypothetical protein JXA54_06400 [Candidatus Heimdallarchaeota archaeon]|nr:hypothetical protein [Candidatus Heimdallarchaeota archaeon]